MKINKRKAQKDWDAPSKGHKKLKKTPTSYTT